jgi:hypothetical protein
MSILRVSLIVFCALAPSGVLACSCAPIVRYLEKESFGRSVFESSNFIVHARVTELAGPHNAKIEIIEMFKGPAGLSAMHAKRGESISCGTDFEVGEEKIFMSQGNSVSACGKLPPDPRLIRAFRKYRR